MCVISSGLASHLSGECSDGWHPLEHLAVSLQSTVKSRHTFARRMCSYTPFPPPFYALLASKYMYRLATCTCSLWPASESPTGYGLLMHCSRKQHIRSNAWHYHTLSVVHNQRCEFQITRTMFITCTHTYIVVYMYVPTHVHV